MFKWLILVRFSQYMAKMKHFDHFTPKKLDGLILKDFRSVLKAHRPDVITLIRINSFMSETRPLRNLSPNRQRANQSKYWYSDVFLLLILFLGYLVWRVNGRRSNLMLV